MVKINLKSQMADTDASSGTLKTPENTAPRISRVRSEDLSECHIQEPIVQEELDSSSVVIDEPKNNLVSPSETPLTSSTNESMNNNNR